MADAIEQLTQNNLKNPIFCLPMPLFQLPFFKAT